MSASSAVIREIPRPERVREMPAAPDFGWYLFGWLGVVFTVIGMFDILLSWVPFAFGDAEWEFGTVTTTMDSLPLATLGLGLLLGSSVARGKRWVLRGVSAVLVLLGISIVGAALLYATEVPLALRAMQDPTLALAMKKAVLKTSVQLLMYPVLFFWLAMTGWRHSEPASSKGS